MKESVRDFHVLNDPEGKATHMDVNALFVSLGFSAHLTSVT